MGIGIAVAAALVPTLFWLLQRRLIYLPQTRPVAPAETVLADSEDVTFETEDGLVLHGWFVPAARGPSSATMLVLNGNAGDRSARAALAAAVSHAGMSALLFDYRGYGGNPGRPSEPGLLADARAARAYLAGRADVDAARIVYFGESLGAAVAVALAAEESPMALVLRSPFTALSDVGQLHYPYLPVRALLWDRFPVVDLLPAIDAPVLVVAGERDRIVPPGQSRQVYEAANEPKRLVVIPGAGHNDDALLSGRRFLGEVIGFVREVAGPR
ncbi:MAG: alpha/beta hydrolase [Actinomycetota bacterium]|nr:alpha/beta hydrolase [Actinomycetota bacterium]